MLCNLPESKWSKHFQCFLGNKQAAFALINNTDKTGAEYGGNYCFPIMQRMGNIKKQGNLL